MSLSGYSGDRRMSSPPKPHPTSANRTSGASASPPLPSQANRSGYSDALHNKLAAGLYTPGAPVSLWRDDTAPLKFGVRDVPIDGFRRGRHREVGVIQRVAMRSGTVQPLLRALLSLRPHQDYWCGRRRGIDDADVFETGGGGVSNTYLCICPCLDSTNLALLDHPHLPVS